MSRLQFIRVRFNTIRSQSLTMANTLRRLSVAFKLGKNQRNGPTDSTATLAEFLSATKQEYLKAINEKRGGEWTVVMGNEAGGKFTF